MDFPWWLSGKESACQCRGHGFDPWSRKIPRAVEQLSLHTTTRESQEPRARAAATREASTMEARAPQLERGPAHHN